MGGQVTGLLVPEPLTRRLRLSESQYHAAALTMGGAAGLAAAPGLGLLPHRRLRVPAARSWTGDAVIDASQCLWTGETHWLWPW
ncbi:respiratory nitrate reductase subunit gamma [Streptomyces sp. IMTB 2501]|uniref:respiratory nitrate reductase subunit gamma n=1 Tax=Streptomyces sp. IMTB 2501 TaxID=1776340 RepID=UPI000D19EF03|nr:respiratory nitrate reductase subunit gamma [Streptomyces sp. IMTB 2501]